MKKLTHECNILSNEFKRPNRKGVRAGLTDAGLVDHKMYFLAAAEDSASTYEDGKVLGSLIGSINIETMKIDFNTKMYDTHKFEGLYLFKNSDGKIEFLLCEDNDTEELKENIYKLTLSKK